jgi:ketosteroid isomerase-like protein
MGTSAGVSAAFAIVLVTGCAHTRLASTDRDRVFLEHRQSDFFAAVAARDADGLAALFADAAVVHVANMPPIEGRDAIHRFYGNMFRFLSGSSATPETIQVSDSGDLAYGIGSVSNEFRGPEGRVEYAGKYVLVWRKIAGDWMVVLYSISSNQPSDRQ